MSDRIGVRLQSESSSLLTAHLRKVAKSAKISNKVFVMSSVISQMTDFAIAEGSGFVIDLEQATTLFKKSFIKINIRFSTPALNELRAAAVASSDTLSSYIRKLMVGWEPSIEDFNAYSGRAHGNNSSVVLVFIPEVDVDKITLAAINLSAAHSKDISGTALLRGHLYRAIDQQTTLT